MTGFIRVRYSEKHRTSLLRLAGEVSTCGIGAGQYAGALVVEFPELLVVEFPELLVVEFPEVLVVVV